MYAFFNIIAAFLGGTLVALFVGVSVLILAAGLLRRWRVKDVSMSWPSGRFFGLPLCPTLFLAAVVILIGQTVITGEQVFSISWVALGAYAFGGLCWYLGEMLSGATMVTDWGVDTQSGRRHLMLPWHDVTDYVVTDHRKRRRYVFFRVDAQGYKQRVEIFVPPGLRERFQSIVELKLDSRFDRSIQRPMGQQALEQ